MLDSRPRTIRGVAADDPYWTAITDNAEEPFAQFCRRYVRDDYICLDIGANIGITTLIMAGYCPDGRVLSIEPARAVFSALQQNIAENGLRNVTAVRAAVGEKNGPIRFVESSAWGHVASGHVSDRSADEVEMVTIERLMATFGLPRTDFIKIDVEGFEPVILRNCTQLLAPFHPLLYLEFNSWCLTAVSKTNPIDFLHFIFDNFRHVFVIKRSGADLLEKLDKSGILDFAHANMVLGGCVDDLVLTNDLSRLRECRQPAAVAQAVGSAG